MLRSRRKYLKRGSVPQAGEARQVVQMDGIGFDGLFAFTAVDIWSREAALLLRLSLTSHYDLVFLQLCMKRRFDEHVELLQTDAGPEFKGDLLAAVSRYCGRHRVARPFKKNEQSYIESFNRAVRCAACSACLG